MADALTSLTEFAVGAGCLIAAGATIRRPRTRWLGIVLGAAGAVAVVHAVAALGS